MKPTFEQTREEVQRLQQQAERAEGSLETLLQQLQEELGCKSVKQAEKKLAKLEAQRKKLEAKAEQALEEFEEEFGEQLRQANRKT